MTFYPTVALGHLQEGEPLAVEIDDHEVVLVRLGDEVHAMKDECSHGQVKLSEGEVDSFDCTIECYLHGSTFDLRSGKPQCLPATEPVPVYPTKIEGETVMVELPTQGAKA